jgi:2-pyrone-4,6-dicarboxylate lactonase
MAARATPRGWHLQFYTPGTVVRDLLPFLADLEDTFVIDHMGYMLEADGLTSADFDRLLRVLEQGRCWIKLSGPYRIAKQEPLSSLQPLGRALVATRPDRLLWGSDWPHLPDGQRDTGELLNLLADWAPDRPTGSRSSWTRPTTCSSRPRSEITFGQGRAA